MDLWCFDTNLDNLHQASARLVCLGPISHLLLCSISRFISHWHRRLVVRPSPLLVLVKSSDQLNGQRIVTSARIQDIFQNRVSSARDVMKYVSNWSADLGCGGGRVVSVISSTPTVRVWFPLKYTIFLLNLLLKKPKKIKRGRGWPIKSTIFPQGSRCQLAFVGSFCLNLEPRSDIIWNSKERLPDPMS